MFTTLPLELFVCREVRLDISTVIMRLTTLQVVEQFFFSHESFSLQRHVFFTTTILLASMLGTYFFLLHQCPSLLTLLIVALITCDLGIMLELTGGVSATALAFIFPAACYLKLTPGRWYGRPKLAAVACCAFGFVVMVMSLFFALRKLSTQGGEAKMCI